MYSCLVSNSVAWAGGDVALGATSWVNLIVILIMSKTVIDLFKDYESQIKAGKTPVFKASSHKIAHTEIWDNISKKYEQEEEQ